MLLKIGEVKTSCPICEWVGTVEECVPDVDGEGSLGCPKCEAVVITHMNVPPKEQT